MVLEDARQGQRDLRPAVIVFAVREQARLGQIVVEVLETTGMADDRPAFGAEADLRQISSALQPTRVLLDRSPVDSAAASARAPGAAAGASTSAGAALIDRAR